MAGTATGGDFPTAPGFVQHSGTGIPVIYSKLWNYKFYLQTVLPMIANTDWEQEVRAFGDQVVIRNIPDITVEKYYKNKVLTYENPEITTTLLNIDQGFVWSFNADIIDLHQTDINFIEKQVEDASNQVKIKVESDIFSTMFADADTANQGIAAGKISGNYNLGATGVPLIIDSTNIISIIVRAGAVLDEQNVPDDGNRWFLMPSEICSFVKTSDLKDASLSGDMVSIVRNGRLGMIDRFNLYCTNNLTTTTDGTRLVYNMMAGHTSALTFAGQITESETIIPESTFGRKYRGLFAYGHKVVKKPSLAHIYGAAA